MVALLRLIAWRLSKNSSEVLKPGMDRVFQTSLLVGDHHPSGLLCVTAAAHPQVMVRFGQHEIPEESV
jgi:hypothetical protein